MFLQVFTKPGSMPRPQKRFETQTTLKAYLARPCGTVTMLDERRAHRILATDRVPSQPRISEVRSPLWRWPLSEKSVLLGSVSRDGVRAVDVPRESPRHRSMPSFGRRQALPHGVPQQGGTLDVGRCERITRLEDLR